MGILFAFAPFIAFALAAKLWGGLPGLAAGAAVSAVVLGRDLIKRKAPKILEAGAFALFAGMALDMAFGGASWSIFGVRLRVDVGLFAIVLGSMAVRRPFTLQYAREQVPEAAWRDPRFIRANYVITSVWALAFAGMVVADLVLAYVPVIPSIYGIAASVAVLLAAYKFTDWYPRHLRGSLG